MYRFWSLLILLTLLGGVLTFWYAPDYRIWFPLDVSAYGYKQDDLFMFILYLTGAVFVATEAVLFWFMWKYGKRDESRRVQFTHGSHTLEVVWSIVPAATLLFIAIFQLNAWAEFKMDRPKELGPNGTMVPKQPLLEVKARQFEWRLRYRGKDNLLYTADDQFTVNEVVIPVNETIVLDLKSEDVLHSFFIPAMRVKQDAVPGMKIPVWFTPTKVGEYDLVCAELCGWGHYKMKGRIRVVTADQFEEWQKTTLAAENDTTGGKPESEGQE
jgi:cytochrome c oxidase subunit 2